MKISKNMTKVIVATVLVGGGIFAWMKWGKKKTEPFKEAERSDNTAGTTTPKQPVTPTVTNKPAMPSASSIASAATAGATDKDKAKAEAFGIIDKMAGGYNADQKSRMRAHIDKNITNDTWWASVLKSAASKNRSAGKEMAYGAEYALNMKKI